MTREEFKIRFSQNVAESDAELFETFRDGSAFAPYVDLSNKGLDTLTNIAAIAAEPLFEEIETLRDLCQRTALENGRLRKAGLEGQNKIEKLEESEEDKIEIIKDLEDRLLKAENDRAYWFDMFGLEKHTTLELVEELERRNTYIEALESDVKILDDLAKSRQNEISGLQTLLNEKDKQIDRMAMDIGDLAICEDCRDEAERLPENNCFPPRYCHRCRFPELYKLFEKEK